MQGHHYFFVVVTLTFFFFFSTVLLPFYHADSRTLWLLVRNRKTVKWALIIHMSRRVSGPRCSVGGFYMKGKFEH